MNFGIYKLRISVVVVTGAYGYITRQVVALLLQKNYTVGGTVLSQHESSTLSRLFNTDKLILEQCPDFSVDNAFEEVFKKYNTRIEHVIHTASPVIFQDSDVERHIIQPALNGTIGVLDGLKKYSAESVKTLVHTSSIAATTTYEGLYVPGKVINEDSWNDETREEAQNDAVTAYFYSKPLAEHYTRYFLQNNKVILKYRLTTVHPGYVFGPQAFQETAGGRLNETCQIIKEVVDSNVGDELNWDFSAVFVDVRDVAKAHVAPLENPELDQKRLLLTPYTFSLQEIADIINENFPELRGKIATGNPGNGKEINKKLSTFDNSRTQKLLGIDFIDLKTSIIDTVDQILKATGRKV